MAGLAAKQKPLAAVVEAAARSCRSRHFYNPHPNAKSPDVPGGVDIAIDDRRMSALTVPRIINCGVIAGLDPAAAGEAIWQRLCRSRQGVDALSMLCMRRETLHAPCSAQSVVCAGHEPCRRRAEAGQAAALSARPQRDAAAGRFAAASAGERDRPPRAAENSRRRAGNRGDAGSHRRPPPPAAAAQRPRAVSWSMPATIPATWC